MGKLTGDHDRESTVWWPKQKRKNINRSKGTGRLQSWHGQTGSKGRISQGKSWRHTKLRLRRYWRPCLGKGRISITDAVPMLGKSKWEPSIQREDREQHALGIKDKMKYLETRYGVNVNQSTTMDAVVHIYILPKSSFTQDLSLLSVVADTDWIAAPK